MLVFPSLGMPARGLLYRRNGLSALILRPLAGGNDNREAGGSATEQNFVPRFHIALFEQATIGDSDAGTRRVAIEVVRVHAAVGIRPDVLEDLPDDGLARLVNDVVLDLGRIEARFFEVCPDERGDELTEPHELDGRRKQRS